MLLLLAYPQNEELDDNYYPKDPDAMRETLFDGGLSGNAKGLNYVIFTLENYQMYDDFLEAAD